MIVDIHRDYETRSRADLKKVGAHRYAQDPSTELLCAVWIATHENGREEIYLWDREHGWHTGDFVMPAAIVEAIARGVQVKGHNAAFEEAIDEHVCGPRMGWEVPKLESLDCTMARCAVQALPLDLSRACAALRLPYQKDMTGHRLMLSMCKPNKAGEWVYTLEKLARLLTYCIADVRAEMGLDRALRPLQEQERPVWVLDQIINNRGVRIDTRFVEAATRVADAATARCDARMRAITSGAVDKCTKLDKLKDFARGHGVELPIIVKTRRGSGEEYESEQADREALEDMLAGDDLPAPVREAFQCRLDASKASTKKLIKLAGMVGPDGRVRDNLQYHAASPGRWGGRGVQMQNLPRRGLTKGEGDFDSVFDDLCGMSDDILELVYGSPLDLISRMLRGSLIASPGRRLAFGDYSQVEARGCVWAAGETAMVELFRTGGRIYEEMGGYIFGINPDDVAKDGLERFVGKTTILGCGYGMGWLKFLAQCKKLGNPITPEIAQKGVYGWREKNSRVVEFWRELEDAARNAIEAPGKVFAAGPFSFRVKGRWLQLRLPSGRIIWYRDPHLAPDKRDLEACAEGEEVPRYRWKIHYWGVNSYTKQWAIESTWGGKLLENAIQGMCRDFLAGAILRLEEAQYPVILTVHDEAITEPELHHGSRKEFGEIMSAVPGWGCYNGVWFPLKADCGEGLRYAKA